LLTISDEAGKEVYSNNFAFDNRCNSKLVGYGGIWIDKDTRPAADRQGCAYASTNDACGDDMDWDPISLTFSGEISLYSCVHSADLTVDSEVTRVSFKDSQVGEAGKSFMFTTVSP
jgi:hypothetical protein